MSADEGLGIEEVRGAAAGLSHDVERRHHQPGAVAQDADVAVELDMSARRSMSAGSPMLLVEAR
jgi:hypothetical protein